ncbi:unnamed protein product [Owenia fusiformis]|uniref:Desmoplakin SH3 domain-containing protein n=1 Tax=Owenia fusiformis TaxID=6347 RepID=A0A8S4NL77_OWEFU|nr:unnamed protein product [Owenia fusiformis]
MAKAQQCQERLQQANVSDDFVKFYKDYETYDAGLNKDFLGVTSDNDPQETNSLLTSLVDLHEKFSEWTKITRDFIEQGLKVKFPVTAPCGRQWKSMCTYKSKNLGVVENEDLTIIGSRNNTWTVQNSSTGEGNVPALALLFPQPDRTPLGTATRLKLKLYLLWVLQRRYVCQQLLHVLTNTYREWKAEESKILAAVDEELLAIMDIADSLITKDSAPLAEYMQLEATSARLRDKISMGSSSIPQPVTDEERQTVLAQGKNITDLLEQYQNFMFGLEELRRSFETCSPALKVNDELDHFITTPLQKRFRYTQQEHFVKETVTEVTETTTIEAPKRVQSEAYVSGSQEEKKKFVISAVHDTKNDARVSILEATEMGIVNMGKGTFLDTATGEKMAIQSAMNRGLIEVEFTSTKKSEEKQSVYGLITITKSKPKAYKVKGITNLATGELVSLEEAMSEGIVDENCRFYRNIITNDDITVEEAIEQGLIKTETEENVEEDEADTTTSKTYAIYGVVDQKLKKKIPFADAVKNGILEPESGTYINNVTDEKIFVGKAIKRGFIKAKHITDPTTLDIDPQNQMVVNRQRTKIPTMR